MRYLAQVILAVEVEAYQVSDAKEAIEDCLNMENCGSLSVVDLEIQDIDELQ